MSSHEEICCNIRQLLVSTRDSKSCWILLEQWQVSKCNWFIFRPVLEKYSCKTSYFTCIDLGKMKAPKSGYCFHNHNVCGFAAANIVVQIITATCRCDVTLWNIWGEFLGTKSQVHKITSPIWRVFSNVTGILQAQWWLEWFITRYQSDGHLRPLKQRTLKTKAFRPQSSSNK